MLASAKMKVMMNSKDCLYWVQTFEYTLFPDKRIMCWGTEERNKERNKEMEK